MKTNKTENDKLKELAIQCNKELNENLLRVDNPTIIKIYLEQAQTQTKLECLKSELEFLSYNNQSPDEPQCSCSICNKIQTNIKKRITKIQQEIKEIENV